MDTKEKTKKSEKSEKSEKSDSSIKKINGNNDIEINGRIYFIPDKYVGTAFIYLSSEHKYLYKYCIGMYLELLIINNIIENISKINKTHVNDAMTCGEKIVSYVMIGKTYINYLTMIEKQILAKVPEFLVQKINPNIIEKIDI